MSGNEIKIMYVTRSSFPSGYGFNELKYNLSEFTINNGCYPDEIHMDDESFKTYINLLGLGTPTPKTVYTFRGIPIRNVEDFPNE